MNTRERILGTIVLGLVLLVGGFMAYRFVIEPMRDKDAAIAKLTLDIVSRQEQIQRVQAEKPKLERWRKLSLPADPFLARREYEKYLTDLFRQSRFATDAYSVVPQQTPNRAMTTGPAKKEPPFTPLAFHVTARGDLGSLVTFLERFHHTGLLHQIKKLAIQRPMTTTGPDQKPGELDISMSIEAYIVQGSAKRAHLLPNVDPKLVALDALTGLRRGPTGLGLAIEAAGPAGPLGPRQLAEPRRQYAAITAKNIFFGPSVTAPERAPDRTDGAQFVYLTDISHDGTRAEAFLYDRFNNRKIRLRASSGFDTFRVFDSQGDTQVQGKVVSLQDRDVIFKVGDATYAIHVGQNVKEALAKPLSAKQVQELTSPEAGQ